MLGDYPGTVLLVSHDRDFLDRVVTSVLAPEGDGTWAEYAGGYSDMLAQRKGLEPRKAANGQDSKAGVQSSPAASDRVAARKLSFKDKHALETLPGEIAKLEKEITGLNAVLADAGLYGRDRVAFDTATAKLAVLQKAIEAAETQWLELEERRASLDI